MKPFAAALGTMLLVLTPLALASPVDPTWIPGLWDDADFDDVILFLTSDLHLLDTSDRPAAGASGLVPVPVLDPPAAVVIGQVYEPGPARAPPQV
jgi:hypothetical protein